MISATRHVCTLVACVVLPLTVGAGTARGGSTEDDLIHHRAMEGVFWSIPLVQFKAMRDAVVEEVYGPGLPAFDQSWKLNDLERLE